MVVNVGSMIIKGVFNTSGITTGIASIIGKLKGTVFASKSLKTELGRLKGTLMGITAASGLLGAGLLATLMNAVMKSPFLSAALAKIRIQFKLLGNAIAKHLKPILETFGKILKWITDKFISLPDWVQGSIVKIIIFGGIILGAVGILGTLAVFLGGVTAALGVLFPAGIMVTLGLFGTALWSVVAGSIVLQAALGLLAGVLGVMALDKLGVLQWISDIGEGFRNWDSIVRDVIVTLLGLPALLGGLAIDIGRGDFDFTTTKAWTEEWRKSGGRATAALTGSYEYGQGSSTSANIGKQENNIVIEANGIQGLANDQAAMDALIKSVTEQLAYQTETAYP